MKVPAAPSPKHSDCARNICQYSVANDRATRPPTEKREAGMRMGLDPNMSTPKPTGWDRKNIRNNCVVRIHEILDAEWLGNISFS